MAKNLYETLGVARDADADAIRGAYRKLAKRYHPDLNPGDKASEARFKDIAAANDILSDAGKRARYDRGEIDEQGSERAPQRPSYADHADGPGGRRYRHAGPDSGGADSGGVDGGGVDGGGVDEGDLNDIFAEFFSQRRGQPPRGRGEDLSYTLSVAFLDAVTGATRRLALPDGSNLDVQIPAGIDDGQILRLKGKGGPGHGNAPAGDALIQVTVEPHRLFRREGRDIHIELPVSLTEAVLGAKVPVPTATGTVILSVPAQSDTGTRLRLRQRGVPARGDRPAGDQFVTLRVALDPADTGLAEFLRGRTAPAFNPRAAMTEAV